MTELFVTVLGVSLSTGILAALLLAVSPLVNRRYAAKWRFWIWAVLAVRLLLPVGGIPSPKPAEAPVTTVSEDFSEAPAYNVPTRPAPSRVIEFTIPEQLNEPIAPQTPKAQNKREIAVTPLGVLTAVWIFGAAAVFLFQFSVFLAYKRKLIKCGKEPFGGEAAEVFSELLGTMKIRGKIRLLICPKASGPMIMGFLKPVLILPDEPFSGEELRFILRHELIHYKRRDLWFKLLFTAAASVHWFNPAVWLMRRRADVDMELSVDEGVVGQSGFDVRRAYTEVLYSTIGRSRKSPNALTTHFSGSKKVMKKRFYNILTKINRKNGAVLLTLVMVLAAAAGALIGCSVGSAEDFEPLEKANEAVAAMMEDGSLELANEILVFSVGSNYADEVQEHEDLELEVTRDGETYMSTFLPMKSPYDNKKSCMKALGEVFTKNACQKREEYFEESDTCRVIDGVLYYEMSEPPHYLYLYPFESAEKVSSREIVAKTKFVWQDNSLSDCEITLKKEGGDWKIDKIVDPEAQRDDPECGCAWPISYEEAGLGEISEEQKQELLDKLRETVGDVEIRAFEAADFDGDGKPEAFGATGDDFDVIPLWFVNENGAEKVFEDKYVVYDGHLLDFGVDKFYTIELSFGTVSWTKIYGVKDGKWYEHEFSGKVSELRQSGDNLLIGVDNNGFDAFYDENIGEVGGHTYKTYYFYYDGGFREYGGIEISEDEFLKLDGAREILAGIEESGATVNNIIYRGGAEIININCSEFDPSDGWIENTNLTAAIDGMSVSVIESNIGVYQNAMIPEIATYADKFDPQPKLSAGVGIIDDETILKLVSEDMRIDKLLYSESPECDFNDVKESNGKLYYRVTDPEIDEWSKWEKLLSDVYAPELAKEKRSSDSIVLIGGEIYCDGGSRGYDYTDDISYSVYSTEATLHADTNETVAERVAVKVKNPRVDGESVGVKNYVFVREAGGDWRIESVRTAPDEVPTGIEIPESFDPEATEEALSLALWDDYKEAAQLLHLHRRANGEAEFDGDVYIPLAEEYDTMEKCETFLHKVFANGFCKQILQNEFGRHRLFVEHDGKMYAISGDFSGIYLCNFPIDGAVYDGENKMSVYTDIWYDGGPENASDYIFRLVKEDGSWKIASIEIPDYLDGEVYYEYSQSYYYIDSTGAEKAVNAWFEDEEKKDYVMLLELMDVSLDWSETYRLREMYEGSELAKERGWSDQELEDKFYVVAAEYNAIYDLTKTFLEDGHYKRYFGLMYHEDSDSWEILYGVGNTVPLPSTSIPSAVPQPQTSAEIDDYYPTATFGVTEHVMVVSANGGIDFSETDETVRLSFTMPNDWYRYQSEQSGSFEYDIPDMPVFRKKDYDPALFRIFPEGTEYPVDFNANEGESETITVLEESSADQDEERPYLFCRRSISHSDGGDREQLEFIVESNGFCVHLRFVKPEDAGEEFYWQSVGVCESVKILAGREIEKIREIDARIFPEITLYSFDEAKKIGKVTETEGLIYPGAFWGTWYTVEVDGVSYFYGQKAGDEDVPLCSWAITAPGHELGNGIRYGMSVSELNKICPDMAVMDIQTFDITNGYFGGVHMFNAYSFPTKDFDKDMWVDNFDAAMIAEIEVPDDAWKEYLAVFVKDGVVRGVTVY